MVLDERPSPTTKVGAGRTAATRLEERRGRPSPTSVDPAAPGFDQVGRIEAFENQL
ncbi:MAG: hypothetical protein IPI44_23500 [Sulfuritalea sp.]|nr:hypothetical protein [Sulfuritalea sp.]